MSATSKDLTDAKANAIAVLPDDGVPRYRVKGSVMEVLLPYSTAYRETFKLSGGTEEPGIGADAKPTRIFTAEGMRRITKLNQLHLPHARKWLEAQKAAQDLVPKAAPTVVADEPAVPREIDKPVEQATTEPCKSPTTAPSST